jgi:acyl phosphate:glycerol-3-phosphate acyltransferase
MTTTILVLAAAYLLGSVPFGYLLVRFFRKEDIRATGSGNIGATNVVRSGAKWLGVATLLLDLGKALAAVLLAKHFAPGRAGFPSTLMIGAGVASILGHVFPVWLGFRGGKGVASALGILFGLSPMVALCALGVFLALALTTRLVSLASIAGAASMPLFALLLLPDRSPVFLGGILFMTVLVIVKHHANISRLLHGTENRFGTKPTRGDKNMGASV